MNEKQLFYKHKKRLVTEGIIKSVLSAFATLLGVNFIFALIYWIWGVGNIFVGVLAGAVLGSVIGVLLYFFVFKPTDMAVARRIDRYGFREKMITMLEFQEDASAIARIQRNDALENLGSFSEKSIKFTLPKRLVAFTAAALVLSTLTLTLGALAMGGVIPYGSELFISGGDGEFEITYVAASGGYLRGDTEQSIKLGDAGTPVRAVADEGYIFVGWNDGNASPERREKSLTDNMVITALFEKIDKSGDGADEEDSADDLPFGSTSNSSGGGNSGDEGGDNPQNGNEGQGGGKWQDKNQFIDGATYYRDYLELYYQYATGIFESDTDIPDELIEFFETYFKGI